MPKKVGIKGKIIHGQGREIISNVSNFMKLEAEEGITIPLKNHRKRVLAATGISRGTYQKISRESQIVEWSGPSASFSSPPKRRTKLDKITIEQVQSIREIIYNFYILDKRIPTLKCILQKINDSQILIEGISISSLNKLLKNIGFRWQRILDNKKTLMETHDIRLKRINYLKKMAEYRNEGRKIIYANVTNIYSTQTKSQKLIIVHAGGEDGFIDNGLLIFRSGLKSGDYQDDMNHDNFIKWIRKQLLPNLPKNSVLVVDNNVPSEKQITSTSLKTEIIQWLTERNLPADPACTKPELYNMVKQNKFRFPVTYKLDELLHEHGHCVLRLPPYHPELNPIEIIFASIKVWVASRNTTHGIYDVEMLTRQKFSEVTVEEWLNICDQVKTHEVGIIEKERLFDIVQEKSLKFTENASSSEENSDTESEDVSDLESGNIIPKIEFCNVLDGDFEMY